MAWNRRWGCSKEQSHRNWNKTFKETGYRSGFEVILAKQLKAEGVEFKYESDKVPYVIPEKKTSYKPDFIPGDGVIRAGKIIIEGKGEFNAEDRKKHLLVREQHPDLDIRFVFYNANSPIYQGSKTTCKEWCEKHGFHWAHKKIPAPWVREIKRQIKGE